VKTFIIDFFGGMTTGIALLLLLAGIGAIRVESYWLSLSFVFIGCCLYHLLRFAIRVA
jgi:hypothetical protein